MLAQLLLERSAIERAPLRLTELEDPLPGPGEVRLKVSCCAICRTDLHVIEGDLRGGPLPIVPGHQVVGVVERLGEGCSRLRLGERVGVAWLGATCHHCEYCRSQKENLCVRPTFTGYQRNGGFAEKIVAKEDFVYPLPERIDDVDAAPLLCAGIIGYRALERSNFRRGARLGIFGFGSSAHIVIQLALGQGGSVAVVTRAAEHRALARRLGASEAVELAAELGSDLDCAILFAPTGELVPAALSRLKRGGTLAVAGIHVSQIPLLDYEKHLFYERDLRSVTANTRADGAALFREAERLGIRPKITRYAFQEANRALLDLKLDRISGTGVLEMKP